MIVGISALTSQIPASEDQSFWTWTGASEVQSIEIDLIRGNVTVVRREGQPVIRIVRMLGAGRSAEVSIEATADGGVLTVRDRYPSDPTMTWDECLPPIDGRGDFWNNSVRFDTTVWAPPATIITAKVKDGRVKGADR